MILHEDGNYRVTRDESRLIKDAATLEADMDLFKVLVHYRSIRQLGPGVVQPKEVRVRLSPENQKYQDELRTLPWLIERTNGSRSINDMHYVFGPILASAGVDVVERAVADGYLDKSSKTRAQSDSQRNQLIAANLIKSFNQSR